MEPQIYLYLTTTEHDMTSLTLSASPHHFRILQLSLHEITLQIWISHTHHLHQQWELLSREPRADRWQSIRRLSVSEYSRRRATGTGEHALRRRPIWYEKGNGGTTEGRIDNRRKQDETAGTIHKGFQNGRKHQWFYRPPETTSSRLIFVLWAVLINCLRLFTSVTLHYYWINCCPLGFSILATVLSGPLTQNLPRASCSYRSGPWRYGRRRGEGRQQNHQDQTLALGRWSTAMETECARRWWRSALC